MLQSFKGIVQRDSDVMLYRTSGFFLLQASAGSEGEFVSAIVGGIPPAALNRGVYMVFSFENIMLYSFKGAVQRWRGYL
jgi:hypothetical protein